MKFPCVFPLLNIQGGEELCDDLIVLVLSESHGISQVFGFTCNHNLIKYPIMLSLHIIAVNPLRYCHRLILGDDDILLKILLECSVKPVVNVNLLLYKPRIFFPPVSHQLSLSFIAYFLPPI
jgi:hypothetical protein